MISFDIEGLEIHSEDFATIHISLPRSRLSNETVEALRMERHGQKTLDMVGLLAYLTQYYGSYYGEELLNRLFYSMAAFDLLDDDVHLNKLRTRFEKLYNEYGQDLVEIYPCPGTSEAAT